MLTNAARLRSFLICFVILGTAIVVAALRYLPPPAKAEDAPATEFSAGRGMSLLRDLMQNLDAHPIGTKSNVIVRDRITSELKRIGYETQIESSYACSVYGVCAPVQNVIAVQQGRDHRNAVLLSAHYDSVAAGPGASDDGAGVAAVLEIARALKSFPILRNDVVFLLDDGEEAGLLGIQAFMSNSSLAGRIRAAVNLEARGVSGPSVLFETSGDSHSLLELYRRHAKRPVASSLFQVIYQFLPHDTDFSILRDMGIHGYNFAFIGNSTYYHTGKDTLGAVSPSSLQHQGQNALAAVEGLADAELDDLPAGRAVFFDLLSYRLVFWPVAATLPATGGVLLLFLSIFVLHWRRGSLITVKNLVFGISAFLLCAVAAGAAGVGLSWLLKNLHVLSKSWVPEPAPFIVAFVTLGWAFSTIVSALVLRRTGPVNYWLCVSLGWYLLAAVSALIEPGVTYLFLIPTVAFVPTALRQAIGRTPQSPVHFLLLLPALAVVVLWIPILHHLYDALGLAILPGITAVICWLGFMVGPLSTDPTGQRQRIVATSLASIAVIAVVIGIGARTDSVNFPDHLTFTFHQDGATHRARYLVRSDSSPLPVYIRTRLSNPKLVSPFAWSGAWQSAVEINASPVELPPPTLTVLDDSRADNVRTVHLRLRSERGAPTLSMHIPGSVKMISVMMEGVSVPGVRRENLRWFGGWWSYTSLSTPRAGVEVTLSWIADESFTAFVLDQSIGLPESGKDLLKSRPLTATPEQDGDVTVLSQSVAF